MIAGSVRAEPKDLQTNSVSELQADTTILVTRTGRVVKGNILSHAGGYMIEMKHGSIFLPFDSVRLQAKSLTDAYQKLRRSLPEFTAANHVALAKWCIINKLFAHAKTELLDALEFEPNHSEARKTLSRLDAIAGRNANPKKKAPAKNSQPPDGFAEVESLNGLSRASGITYSKRIQPILKNKCASAGCHASTGKPTQIPFKLQRYGGRGHRIYAERNLAEVLKYISIDSPGSSRILEGLAPGHGRNGRLIFNGRAGKIQTETLRAWVYQVSKERKKKQPRGNVLAKVDSDSRQHPSSTARRNGKTHSSVVNENRDGLLKNKRLTNESESRRSAIMNSIREDAKPDPFDPDVFNRQVSSKTSKTDSQEIGSPQKRK